METCSKVEQSIYCKQLPRVLRARERKCASALLTDATKAHQLCDINESSADCNLSPLIQINESLYYFTDGCDHILRLFQNSQLNILTTNPLLFTKTSDMTFSLGTISILTPIQLPTSRPLLIPTVTPLNFSLYSRMYKDEILRQKIEKNYSTNKKQPQAEN